MNFLKLTGINGKVETINFDYVIRFSNNDYIGTVVIISEGNETFGLTVKETIEYIQEMLNI